MEYCLAINKRELLILTTPDFLFLGESLQGPLRQLQSGFFGLFTSIILGSPLSVFLGFPLLLFHIVCLVESLSLLCLFSFEWSTSSTSFLSKGCMRGMCLEPLLHVWKCFYSTLMFKWKNWLDLEFCIENNFTSKIYLHTHCSD